MRTTTLIAIILYTIGIAAIAYQGIAYSTRDKVVDIGPLNTTTEKTRPFPLPPIAGAVVLVGGTVLLVMGNKKS